MSKVVTRFAPSPTGHLHVGNMRTALICYLYAKKHGGDFILRIDDTDTGRSKPEYVDGIKADLTWMGLKWDATYSQSERIAKYQEAKEKLIKSGRVYPCYETQVELEVKRKMQMKRGLPPIYDRAALALTSDKIAEFEQQGRKPHYRFKLDDGDIIWNDLVKGEIKFLGKNLSDPILIREDGSFTYMLPSTVDDVDMQISHVVRGEDHITNTAIQIQIFKALGAVIPQFAHLSLIRTKDAKISKREGGFEIKELKSLGIEPVAIASFFARVGTSEPVEARQNLDEVIAGFDIKKFNKAPTNYDFIELERVNIKVIHNTPYSKVASLFPEIDENFWLSVRPNLKKIDEVQEWWRICKQKLEPVLEDKDFTAEASKYLPEGKWSEQTWGEWTAKVADSTGRKGKLLFMPIRKALTGMEHGPELKNLLPLMDKDKVIARLNGQAA